MTMTREEELVLVGSIVWWLLLMFGGSSVLLLAGLQAPYGAGYRILAAAALGALGASGTDTSALLPDPTRRQLAAAVLAPAG